MMILRVATLNLFKNQIKLLSQLKDLGRYVLKLTKHVIGQTQDLCLISLNYHSQIGLHVNNLETKLG